MVLAAFVAVAFGAVVWALGAPLYASLAVGGWAGLVVIAARRSR